MKVHNKERHRLYTSPLTSLLKNEGMSNLYELNRLTCMSL